MKFNTNDKICIVGYYLTFIGFLLALFFNIDLRWLIGLGFLWLSFEGDMQTIRRRRETPMPNTYVHNYYIPSNDERP